MLMDYVQNTLTAILHGPMCCFPLYQSTRNAMAKIGQNKIDNAKKKSMALQPKASCMDATKKEKAELSLEPALHCHADQQKIFIAS